MKSLCWLIVCVCTLTVISCHKSETGTPEKADLVGTWKLVETLADPGDGSGTWKPVTGAAQTTITFSAAGDLMGNAFPQANRYAVLNDSNIRFTFDDGTFINYTYSLTETTLVLSGGGCIEACGAKFLKENGK